MKFNKGITLMSLAVYVTVVLIAVVMLSAVLSNFRKTADMANDKTTDISEYNMFELYFLKDAKKTENYIESIDNSFVQFTSGAKYEYKSNKIYLVNTSKNKEIILVNNVGECTFSKNDEKEKTFIRVELTINDKDYTLETAVGN